MSGGRAGKLTEAFWDYAAAAPYVTIRARESAPGAGDHKDAIFLSPHKFIGGPQTPGVLVVRRDLVPQARRPAGTARVPGIATQLGAVVTWPVRPPCAS